MNIKITYNWLLEYLDTDADPYELQKYLSLSGPSIERVEKIDDDYVLDIEITSNRVDMASVLGIAQEAQAILPMFGKKARLKDNPLEKFKFSDIEPEQARMTLEVKITNPKLCSRFTAIVLSNTQIKESPEIIKKRLTMCDIKSINNVIDISNYLMLSLGQPTHIFDYDHIGKATMIMRESKKGERMITLDDKEITLPGGDIIIEDGNGDIIDLCGIMGGLNSSIKNNTKNIILFVQTYNKQKIRKTSMLTGQRTVAATFFEKGLDEERVEPTLVYGIELLRKITGAQIASKLYDIYPNTYKPKAIQFSMNKIRELMGINIENQKAISILKNLGIQIKNTHDDKYEAIVPSWRKDDIKIKEDITEEVARVYGYYNLPNNIPVTEYVKQPKDVEMFFVIQSKIKYFLKHLGLHEVLNYSMISGQLIENIDEKKEDCLEVANTISEEIRYLRTSLLPSLIKNMKNNQGKKDLLNFFEISKIYIPKENDLPDEKFKLAIATNTDFFDIKGIVEALFKELNIEKYSFKKGSCKLLSQNVQAEILINGVQAGQIGELKPTYQIRNGIKQEVYLAQIDLTSLIENYKVITSHNSPTLFATVKLDLTIDISSDKTFEEIKKTSFETSKYLLDIEMLNLFNDKLSIRFYFSKEGSNITETEAKQELENIKNLIM